jgi:hypothetical protein
MAFLIYILFNILPFPYLYTVTYKFSNVQSSSADQLTPCSAGPPFSRSPIRGIENEVVRFEVFTAVTLKNAIFWDIKPQFVPHRRHITSPLQSPAC